MKRLIALLLALLLLLSAVGCGSSYYDPVESTEQERATALTFTRGDTTYRVPFEVYRAFFLSYRAEIDGGDTSVWSGPQAADHLERLHARILPRIADIYATLYLSASIGHPTDTADCDRQVLELIRQAVDASPEDGGAGGDYDAYLAQLKDMYLNYSVQDLLLRYSIAYNAVLAYYGGVEDETDPSNRQEPHLAYTPEDVKRFYQSDDCVLVLMAMLDTRSYSATRAQQIRDRLNACTTAQEASNYIMGHTATTADDGVDGMLIGRYSLDEAYFTSLSDTAFTLSPFSASQPITVQDGTNSYYCILYRIDKPADYDATDTYVQNEIGKLLAELRDAFLADLTVSDSIRELDHSTITMNGT